MAVPPETIKVGRCYLTDAARVQRVLEITPDGKVIHAHRSTRSEYKAWTAGTTSLRAFAFITVREVPCDWTPRGAHRGDIVTTATVHSAPVHPGERRRAWHAAMRRITPEAGVTA